MTRILIVETASPKRIYHKIEEILESGIYPEPEIFILCKASNRRAFAELSGVKLYSTEAGKNLRIPRELSRKKFDIVFGFWAGEKRYHRMKLLLLRIKAGKTYITAGDGNEFRLTWKAICRHIVFRIKHPLPTDHCDFALPPASKETLEKKDACGEKVCPAGERVLIIQSAEPAFILKALERLKCNSLFHSPRYTIFCRNRPDALRSFQNHSMLDEILVHSEARGSWKHLRNLRGQGFSAAVLFLTGDPSYRKIKVFAFLLGIPLRHMLIFNEAADCFFFNWNQWLGLVSHRIRERPNGGAGIKYICDRYIPISSIIKLVLLPFRFLWLLLVWVRLRLSGIKSSRKNHDYSLQLPPFPGA